MVGDRDGESEGKIDGENDGEVVWLSEEIGDLSIEVITPTLIITTETTKTPAKIFFCLDHGTVTCTNEIHTIKVMIIIFLW